MLLLALYCCQEVTAHLLPDLISVNAALRALSWKIIVLEFHESRSLSTLRALPGSCERPGQWQPALCLLKQYAFLVPDIISFSTVASACEKDGRWEEALCLLSQLGHARIVGDLSFYNAVISAAEKGSRWQLALQLLPVVSQLQLKADVISYSSAISACQKCDEWQAALQLLSEMQSGHVKLDVYAFNAAISACRQSWLKALYLLNSMQFCAIQSTVITCGSVISCCCEKAGKAARAPGRWQLALQVLRAAQMQTLRLQDITYNAAIGACEKGQRNPRSTWQNVGRSSLHPLRSRSMNHESVEGWAIVGQ